MTKKPKGIYLIIIWFWICLGIQKLAFLNLLKNNVENISAFKGLISILSLGLLIIMAVGLWKVKHWAINIAVILFLITVIVPIINIVIFNLKINNPSFIIRVEVLSILSLWYLLIPSHRKIFKEYREEDNKN